MSIIIDPEFQSLIPPLSKDEYTQLEKNIVKDGIRDALIVWPQGNGNSILIDGHNRFQISASHAGIRFEVREKNFKDRDEAIVWIANNQLGRRNLHPLDQERLLSVKRELEERKAKERMMAGVKANPKEKFPEGTQTRDIIGKEIGVSGRQVDKLHAINEKATERTKQLVREGKLSINQAYNSTRDKKPDPVQQAKEEHKEYEQKKAERTVDIKDAQMDKVNKGIINRALLEEVQKLLNTVEKFGFNHSSDELNGLSQMIDRDESAILSGMCERSQLILEKIKYGLQRRN